VIAFGLGPQSSLLPRMPCYKLGIRFGRPEIVKRFLQSGRSGFYLSVLGEGQVTAGDSVERITRDERGVTVTDIVNLYKADETNQDLLRRASKLPALPPFWRDYFRERLWDPDS
jgi:MOSC domain-containing protein YiiM